MKRLTLEQILALYPEALIFNMLDIRLRKDRHEALKDLAGAYILFCHLQILRRPAAATLQLQGRPSDPPLRLHRYAAACWSNVAAAG